MRNQLLNAFRNGTMVLSTLLCLTSCPKQVEAQCSTPAPITGGGVLCPSSYTTTLSDITTGGTWSVSDGSCVSVNPSTGVVTGISGGIGIVTYSVPGGCYVTFPVKESNIVGPIAVCSAGPSVTMSDILPGGTWSTTSSDISITPGGGVISVAGGFSGPTTPATIVYTPPISSGCTAISTVINVDLTPTITSLVSDPTATSICEGTPINFTTTITGGTAPYTYNWWWGGGTFASNSGVVGTTSTGYQMGGITMSEAGTYIGNVVDYWGCISTYYTGPTISVIPGPLAYTVSYATSSHAPGCTLELSSSDVGINYSYGIVGLMTVGGFPGTGFAITCTTDPTASGNYFMVGCNPSTTCCSFMTGGIPVCPTCRTINPQLSVSTTQAAEQLSLFPNPTTGNFTLNGSADFISDEQNVNAEVIDITGHLVFTRDIAVSNGSINYSIQLPGNIPNGMYLLKLSTGTQREILPLTLSR